MRVYSQSTMLSKSLSFHVAGPIQVTRQLQARSVCSDNSMINGDNLDEFLTWMWTKDEEGLITGQYTFTGPVMFKVRLVLAGQQPLISN